MTYKIALSALLTSAALAFGGAAQADGIGASLLTQQHPFYIELADAMKAEAEAKGVPLEISIANQDLNKQLADVEDFIVKGVDVIVISPVDSQGVMAAIAKAEAAGIKVVTVDVPAANAKVTSRGPGRRAEHAAGQSRHHRHLRLWRRCGAGGDRRREVGRA
ncbi:substrate-binding domain-containing protein [Paracoccus yeei]|uniref:substrate-binding domain-containing protein n=1 Tax=Paracoccus yeei TaxID=147645 RepID=UPI001CC30F91|nr:substrate-binding domain-containing protein [Paracoccus yeei]